MAIPEAYYPAIQNIDVMAQNINAQFNYWLAAFAANDNMNNQITIVSNHFVNGIMNRANITQFYLDNNIDIQTKFIAAMIWGYEAPIGGQRDKRGPAKVNSMFQNYDQTVDIINQVNIETLEESFNLLKRIYQLATSFITKHLYFLARSVGNPSILIFDNRVASGLTKVLSIYHNITNFVKVQRKDDALSYIHYLEFMTNEANMIACSPEQVELFLYNYE